jgi:hypothetical protein
MITLLAALALRGCAYHSLFVPNGEALDRCYHPVNSEALGWNVSAEQSLAE